MAKIGILSRDLIGSGIDRIIRYQAKSLVESGHQVSIIALSGSLTPPKQVELRLLLRPFGFYTSRFLYLTLPLNILAVARNFRYLAGFDILIAHYYPMTWLADFMKGWHRSRYILYNHGILDTTTQDKRFVEKAYVRSVSLLYAATLGQPDVSVSISEYTRAQLRKQIGLESKVILNPIDTVHFKSDADPNRIRLKHGLGNSRVLLFVGLIEPRKGIHILVEVHKAIKKEFPDTKLLIVGSTRYGRYLEFIREMIDDSVTVVGWVAEEDLPYYFAACDVYVTASSWEGFDLPVAEAQACGKPVVAFDIGSHREIVESGQSGFLVRFGDTTAFVGAVKELLSNARERDRMGIRGRAAVKTKFSYARFATETQSLIRGLS